MEVSRGAYRWRPRRGSGKEEEKEKKAASIGLDLLNLTILSRASNPTSTPFFIVIPWIWTNIQPTNQRVLVLI